jgi:hypothetical protein
LRIGTQSKREATSGQHERKSVCGHRPALENRIPHGQGPDQHGRGLHQLQPGVCRGEGRSRHDRLNAGAFGQEPYHGGGCADEGAEREQRQALKPAPGHGGQHAANSEDHAALHGVQRGHAVHHDARWLRDKQPGRSLRGHDQADDVGTGSEQGADDQRRAGNHQLISPAKAGRDCGEAVKQGRQQRRLPVSGVMGGSVPTNSRQPPVFRSADAPPAKKPASGRLVLPIMG